MEVGETLKFFRQKMDLKQEDLLPKDMFSVSTLSKIESGQRTLKVSELQIILDRLSITFAEFFKLTEFDAPQDNFIKDYYTCASNPKDKKNKKTVLKHYKELVKLKEQSQKKLSNYISLVNFFSYHYPEEIQPLDKKETLEIVEKISKKEFLLHYDLTIISNTIFMFSIPKQNEILERIKPKFMPEIRSSESLGYINRLMNNMITANIYCRDTKQALKNIETAKNLNYSPTQQNQGFKLIIIYLENIVHFLRTKDLDYWVKAKNLVNILELFGDTITAECLSEELDIILKEENLDYTELQPGLFYNF